MKELKKQLNRQLKKQLYITPLISFEEIENDDDLMNTISGWATNGDGNLNPIINEPDEPGDSTCLPID